MTKKTIAHYSLVLDLTLYLSILSIFVYIV